MERALLRHNGSVELSNGKVAQGRVDGGWEGRNASRQHGDVNVFSRIPDHCSLQQKISNEISACLITALVSLPAKSIYDLTFYNWKDANKFECHYRIVGCWKWPSDRSSIG